jgi:hypothetical protein
MDPEEKGYAWLFDDGGGTGDAASDECGCEGKPRWAIGDVHTGGADASGAVCDGGEAGGMDFGGTLKLACGTQALPETGCPGLGRG